MLYDIRLALTYDYDAPVHGGRHLVRVVPGTIPGVQRVVAASLTVEPKPREETSFLDFFGNHAVSVRLDQPHEALAIRLAARVLVDERSPVPDTSPSLSTIGDLVARFWSVEPDSPHHFLADSPRVQTAPAITAYALEVTRNCQTVLSAAHQLCRQIHADFKYDARATDVETKPSEAFALRKGVCQDFAHVMIAAARGIGIPAGYVSGFLRTEPPPGKARLEGADAMHAWIRVWCGPQNGWVEFDPTNAMPAGADHISIGHGRDYSDISPIIGMLRTRGSHEAKQSVDVIPLG
jgi:transglutaminase-like putative cysteine protease